MWSKSLKIFGHVVIWLGLYLLISPWPLGLVQLELMHVQWQPLLTDFQWGVFLLYGFGLNAVLTYGYAHVSMPRLLRSRKPQQFIKINGIYLLIFTLFESFLDFFYLHLLAPEVLAAGGAAPLPHFLGSWAMPSLLMTLFMLAWANVYGFAHAWFHDQKIKGAMEREKLRAEIVALKHQINPHFLFNILNALYGMAFENDDEPTAEGIAKLSNMMRYILYESNEDEVRLQKELEYLENYIDLQKMRVNESVQIDFEVKGNPSGHLIPPMVFQPLIENAFKYGISQVRPSRIDIHMNIEPERLHFSVRNTKHPVIQKETKHKGIGLKNVRKRLDLLCKNCHRLLVKDGDNYFSVELELELIDPMRRHFPQLFSGTLKKG
jgi:two-component system LytT family sensor kinase